MVADYGSYNITTYITIKERKRKEKEREEEYTTFNTAIK